MSSESTSEVKFFNNQSYDMWRMRTQGVLKSLDLWKFVDGDYPCPGADTSGDANSIENVERWMESDKKAKTFMMATINEPGRNQVEDCKTSNEMWLKLEEIFGYKGPNMKTVFMKRLLSLKMNDKQNVRAHVQNFCEIVEKLTEMEVTINEHFLCTLLLQSLPNSFQDFRHGMESMDEFPPLKDLARKIMEEAIRKKNLKTPKNTECVLPLNDSMTSNLLGEKFFWPVGDSTNIFKNVDRYTCWVLHSNMPYHICSEALLPRITPAEFAEYVCMEGPDWILNSGTMNICSQYPERSLTIQNILCMRGFEYNILSLNKLQDMGYQVIFEHTNARIIDKDGCNILTAYKVRDFYCIVEDTYKKTTLAFDDVKPAEETSGLFDSLTKWLGLSSRR